MSKLLIAVALLAGPAAAAIRLIACNIELARRFGQGWLPSQGLGASFCRCPQKNTPQRDGVVMTFVAG
jgi:hypothetical protein